MLFHHLSQVLSFSLVMLFQDLVEFNSRVLILLRTWSNCTFAQFALSAKLFHSRKSLIGGSSSVELSFLFLLSIALSEQLLLNDQYRRPNANFV